MCYADTYHTILNLDSTKKTSGDIPTKILKVAIKEATPIITSLFNRGLQNGIFPHELKLAEVIPVHKKTLHTEKENYRPISLLPTISKVFEKLISKQLKIFMKDKLSKFLFGFRKGHSTQYALFNLVQNWQACLSNSEKIGTILMDLSKAFDCLPHDLLIAKLAAYGLGYRSLRFLWSYLTDRKMRVRVGSALSEWLNIILGVPQGSILGPILFNIFINDLFLLNLESQICNFADDNTLYSCDISLDKLIQKLHKDSISIIKWFRYNEMVVNPEKFQIMFLGCNNVKVSMDIDKCKITSTDTVKLLGITLDNKLNFNSHIEGICKKANQKISALFRIRKYLDREKAKLLSNSFVLSHFRYCSLI